MRKKSFWGYLILSVWVMSWGCRAQKSGVEMSYQRIFEIPSGLSAIATHHIVFNDVAPDTAIFFNQVSISSADVVAIEPRAMQIQAMFPGSGGLGFIRQIEVSMSAPDAPSLGTKILYFRDDVPLNTGDRIDLVANNADVKHLLLQKRFKIDIKFQTRETSQNNIDARFDWTFFARTE
ncbi:MAG: hypothetical protein RL757_1441 [Bacteroidota bacterium]|jgi:hypothetical protein